MPYGKPKHVAPWTRANWNNLNKGNKLYAIQEWQCYLFRNGNHAPLLPNDIANSLNINRDHISRKALNIFQNNFAERRGEDPFQRDRQSSTEERQPSTSPRGTPDRTRERSPRSDHANSGDESQQQEDFRGFPDDEQQIGTNELCDYLKEHKKELCIHMCSKAIHIIMNNE